MKQEKERSIYIISLFPGVSFYKTGRMKRVGEGKKLPLFGNWRRGVTKCLSIGGVEKILGVYFSLEHFLAFSFSCLASLSLSLSHTHSHIIYTYEEPSTTDSLMFFLFFAFSNSYITSLLQDDMARMGNTYCTDIKWGDDFWGG